MTSKATASAAGGRATPEFVAQARALLGDKGVVTDPADMQVFLRDWRGRKTGSSPIVARPASTAEVSQFLELCARHRVPVVPQGGNTGMVLGALPRNEVVLSLGRMTAVRTVDPLNDSITVEAGCILADVQAAAERADRLLPLSLGSEGIAQIGGLISTNAGGVAVLRYGMMRELVLGLEVVLADGRIWNGLTGLRKDNTAYDLKQLFIGAEGTLGVVTAATLKLFPRPALRIASWLAVDTPEQAVSLLALAKSRTGSAVTSFELVPQFGVDLVLEAIPDTRDPLPDAESGWRVLMEVSFPRVDGSREVLEALLADAMEAGLVKDGVIAATEAQGAAIWKVRETLPLAEKAYGKAVKHDVSVPVSALPAFLARAGEAVSAISPMSHVIAFGHVGDGNLHYNVAPPDDIDEDAFAAANGPDLTRAVHDIVMEMGGSISAEHGIGLQKRDELAERVSPVELDLLRAVKNALDPEGRMNPGRVVKPAV